MQQSTAERRTDLHIPSDSTGPEEIQRPSTTVGAEPSGSSMSSKQQLQFMHAWGERRHQLLAKQAAYYETSSKSSSSCGSRTFVPRAAWEGLPKDIAAWEGLPKDIAAAAVEVKSPAAADEADEEMPLSAALLAHADQLSDESAASVQTLCGKTNCGASGQDEEKSVLRQPEEVATMLRNISKGRRDLYGRDDCALRLERDIRQELRGELDRQNRLDAQLDGVSDSPSPSVSSDAAEHSQCPSEISVPTSVSDQISYPPSIGSGGGSSGGQRGARSDRHPKGAVTRALSTGLGSLTSRLRRRVFVASGSSGEPAAAGGRRKTAPNSAVAASIVAPDAADGSETESSGWDSDSESERRRANRCHWRRSRMRDGGPAVVGGGSGNASNARTAGSNCNNAQTTQCVAVCGPDLDEYPPVETSAGTVEMAVFNFNSALDRRLANLVTDAAGPKKPGDKVLPDELDGDLDKINFPVEQMEPSASGKVSNSERRSAKTDLRPSASTIRRPGKIVVQEPRNSVFFSQSGVMLDRSKSQDERVRMKSQLLEASPQKSRVDYSSVLLTDPDFHYGQSSRFFAEGLPVDEEVKRIVSQRRSLPSVSQTDLSDRSSMFNLNFSCDKKSSKFLSGWHGRLSGASFLGLNIELLSESIENSQVDEKNPKQSVKKKSNISGNRNGSNKVLYQSQHDKEKQAEMVALHGTETHFSSDCREASNFCSEIHASHKTLVRRRCRQVVLIQPQLVHWDLQLTQVVANPRARLIAGRLDMGSSDWQLAGSRSSSIDFANEDSATVSEQLPSHHSLPTVTSHSAILLAEGNWLKPVGSLGQFVNWIRVGPLPREKRSVARVKRVSRRRGLRRSSRVVRVNCLDSKLCHVTEIVENASLEQSDCENSATLLMNAAASCTTTVSTCDAVTNSSGSCSLSTSTKTDATLGSNAIGDVTFSDAPSDARPSTARRRWPSRGRRNSRMRPGQLQKQLDQKRDCIQRPCQQQQRKQQNQQRLHQIPQQYNADEKYGRRRQKNVGELGDVAVRVHSADEAKSSVLSELPQAGEVARLPDEVAYLTCTVLLSCSPAWLFAKRSRQPKSGYSHSVHYLPSIRVQKLAAVDRRGVLEAIETIFIACELTVKRQPPSRRERQGGRR